MKVRNSLKSLRARHRDNQIVRRKGRVYVINKVQKRYKARQGCGPETSKKAERSCSDAAFFMRPSGPAHARRRSD